MKVLSLLVLFVVMVGCAPLPDMVRSEGGDPVQLSTSKYSTVVVSEIRDETDDKVVPDYMIDGFTKLLKADLSQLSGVSVIDGGGKDASVVVSAEIVHYNEGNPTMRKWVGMNTGISGLQVRVSFHDGRSGRLLGTFFVDENTKGAKGRAIMKEGIIRKHITDASTRIAKALAASLSLDEGQNT